jgi:hypothetical protein
MTSTHQPALLSISRFLVFLLGAILFQIAVAVGLSSFLPAVVRPFLVIAALVIIPGSLTSLILYRRQALPFWQIIGFGIGFGLGEMLLWGRLLLTIGVDTAPLSYVLLVTTAVKILWLWRRPFEVNFKPPSIDWKLVLIPLLTLVALWLTLVQVNLTYPAYPVNTVWLNDKWTYLTAIEQFLASPGHFNLRPDAIIFGSNTRVSWNSWLYFTASISQLTGIHPIQLIFQYFRPGLFLMTIFSLFLLGFELFGKTWMALVGVALQLLLLVGTYYEGFWLWMRLEEDKYFAFVTLMPLAWVFLLRLLNHRCWSDAAGLLAVSLSLALIHPLGIPGLLLTGAPIALIEWWLNRQKGFTLRWLIIILVCMSIFMTITLLDQKLIVETPYVQNLLEAQGALPAYTAENAPVLLAPNARFILLALIPLGILGLKDRTARFLFLVTAACGVILCVPLVTALLSRLTTSVGLNRYQWLIPYGFIVVWLIGKVSEWWSVRISRLNLFNPTLLTAGTIGIVILLSGWNQWTTDHNPWLFRQDTPAPTTLNEGLWRGFLETADMVQNKRAITPVEYGLNAPTLWPGADLLIFNSPIHAPLNWSKIEGLYKAQDIATAWMLLDDLQPQALFVPYSANLYSVLSQNPEGLIVAYQNDEVSLFETAIDTPPRKDAVLAFYADQYTLKPGECVILRWETHDLQNLQFDGAPVENTGEREECPSANAVYQLEGTRPDGSTARRALHLFVSPDYAYMASFSADRYVIEPGACVILRWHVEGIDSVFFQDKGTVGESTSEVCPTVDTLYTLRIVLRSQETILRNLMLYVRS